MSICQRSKIGDKIVLKKDNDKSKELRLSCDLKKQAQMFSLASKMYKKLNYKKWQSVSSNIIAIKEFYETNKGEDDVDKPIDDISELNVDLDNPLNSLLDQGSELKISTIPTKFEVYHKMKMFHTLRTSFFDRMNKDFGNDINGCFHNQKVFDMMFTTQTRPEKNIFTEMREKPMDNLENLI